jgi:uncharacterized protein (DUF924 family)
VSTRDSRFDDTSTGPEDILRFWFGAAGSPPLARSSQWYTKDDAFDREIKSRFEETLDLAARGALDGWKTTPRGRLALVILLDQLSRNMFRGTPRAFAQDARACDTALEALAAGDEQVLGIVERSFLYMPLMHAENVDLQHKCVAAFERLAQLAPDDLRPFVENQLAYARRHAEIVERFGRFPHRNAILGRASTPEEIELLKDPRSTF